MARHKLRQEWMSTSFQLWEEMVCPEMEVAADGAEATLTWQEIYDNVAD